MTTTEDNTARDLSPVEAAREERQRQAEARRQQFEALQKAQRDAFEREQVAFEAKLARDTELAEAEAERNAKIAAATLENDDRAMADGLLTPADLEQRRALVAAQTDCMLPHDATAPGEETVKMAFPRNTILTQSADDVRRFLDLRGPQEGDAPVSAVIPHGTRVLFLKGYQDVPARLADHQYLKDNGAYRADGNRAAANEVREDRPTPRRRQEVRQEVQ